MQSIKIFIAESCVPYAKIFTASKQNNDLVLDTSPHRLLVLMELGSCLTKAHLDFTKIYTFFPRIVLLFHSAKKVKTLINRKQLGFSLCRRAKYTIAFKNPKCRDVLIKKNWQVSLLLVAKYNI